MVFMCSDLSSTFQNTSLPEPHALSYCAHAQISRFTADHDFHKPNDERGLQLMNRCAQEVFTKFADVVFAIGMSDEYSFVLRRDAKLFDRRSQCVARGVRVWRRQVC